MVRSKSQMNSLGEKSGLKKNRTALGGRWGKKRRLVQKSVTNDDYYVSNGLDFLSSVMPNQNEKL